MIRRWLQHPLACAPLPAVVLQFLLATAVAAATGGGDFPS